MTTVSVAVLKQKLSSYLHLVEEGQEFMVTAHRRPVARVLPAAGGGCCVHPPTRRPTALSVLKGARLSSGPAAVEILLEGRVR